MNFGQALEAAKSGAKICREGWNGKGMFLFLIEGKDWDFETDIDCVNHWQTLPFICMKTADNKLVPWLASQTDILADDWLIQAN